MNKLSSIVAAMVLTVTVSTASENNIYAGGGLAIQSADSFDSGIALVLNGGMPIMPAGTVGPGTVAVEGEFTYSISDPEKRVRFLGRSFDASISIMTLGAYAAYIYDINEQFYVKPRAGIIYRSYDADAGNFDAQDYEVYTNSDGEFGLSFGIGAGYRLSKEIDIYVDYTMIDGSDVTHLTAGAQYHF